jgi:hypothetical protein
MTATDSETHTKYASTISLNATTTSLHTMLFAELAHSSLQRLQRQLASVCSLQRIESKSCMCAHRSALRKNSDRRISAAGRACASMSLTGLHALVGLCSGISRNSRSNSRAAGVCTKEQKLALSVTKSDTPTKSSRCRITSPITAGAALLYARLQ